MDKGWNWVKHGMNMLELYIILLIIIREQLGICSLLLRMD